MEILFVSGLRLKNDDICVNGYTKEQFNFCKDLDRICQILHNVSSYKYDNVRSFFYDIIDDTLNTCNDVLAIEQNKLLSKKSIDFAKTLRTI